MNKKFFAILIVAVAATFAVYNMYNYRNVRVLSDIVKLNVEALSSPEYDGECVEWATKSCYDKFFSTVQDPFVYHATCSGSSQVGGYLEC
ncbi:NVEALA domain-containing protein, partial [Bacteroides sp.]